MQKNRVYNDKNAWLKLVADLRQKNALSQKIMAEKLGISVATLRKIEKGIFPERIGVEIVLLISREFGVSIRDQFNSDFSVKDL